MFRVGNQRRNQILEAQVTLYLSRDEVLTVDPGYPQAAFLCGGHPGSTLSNSIFKLVQDVSILILPIFTT